MNVRQEIGARIKRRLEFLEKTQAWLAKEFGVEASTMSQYLTGVRGLEAADLVRMADILDVEASYFYGEGEYHASDVPPELQMVHGLHNKVISHLPPGNARDRYIAKLKANAESDWAMIEEREEGKAK